MRRTYAKNLLLKSILSTTALCTVGIILSQDANAANIGDGFIINPHYQQYLADVAAGNGNNWKLIPKEYIPVNRNVISDGLGAPTYPSTYNLTTVGYATPIKDQGMDGICWAYAISTMIESNLKVTQHANVEISPKQLDYLLANNTPYREHIRTNLKPSYDHTLGSGGNFLYTSYTLSGNYAPVYESSFFAKMKSNDPALANYDTFNDYNDQRRIERIVNGNGAAYTKAMDNSLVMGEKSDYIIADYTDYDYGTNNVNAIKQKITDYGAAYVGTIAPHTENCYDKNTNTVVDRGTSVCGNEHNHAMVIVGWDDNHAYTDPITHTAGTGAFIMQNSHGKDSLFSDRGINSATMENFFDLSGLTPDRKTALGNRIDNYKATEFSYLAYDSVNSLSDDIDLANIEKILINPKGNIYELANSSLGSSNNEIVAEYSAGSVDRLNRIALGAHSISASFGINYKLFIDRGSGYEELGSITLPANSSGQRSVELNEPVTVNNSFKLKAVATLASDNSLPVGINDHAKNFTFTAYALNNDPPAEEEGADDETPPIDEIPVPNAGLFTGDQNNAKVIGVIILTVIIASTFIVVYIYRNRRNLNFRKIDFKNKLKLD